MKDLRDLNLSYNLIEVIENLAKLPNLRTVSLDHNKIKKLENLKQCRKLEILSVRGNLLEDLNFHGPAPEPLLELRELHAGRNKI